MSSMDDEEYDYGSEAMSEEEDYGYEDEQDDGVADYSFEAEDATTTSRRAPYEVLAESALRRRQTDVLQDVTSVTGIPEADAFRILRHYKWDANRVNEEYFSDMDKVRDMIGLVDAMAEPATAAAEAASAAPPSRKGRGRAAAKKVLCMICLDEHKPEATLAGPCQHAFCKECWQGYASTAVEGGPACLDLRCPHPECNAAVPSQIMREVLNDAETAMLDQFAIRSFVEDNRQIEWCPAPNCAYAVEARVDTGNEALDITCKCGSTFCFTCKEEAHRPVACETVAKWLLKNSAESENLNWILANTKPCPKCRRPIEKNQGCMHMNCSQCRYEFCWLCLGEWKAHGEGTGGYYSCNRYEQGKKQGKFNEEEARRERAKQSLERYMHYYQRYAENDKARKQAIAKREDFIKTKAEELSEMTATPTSQLKLISDAWAQVVDCRRILKWTYGYGYYQFNEEDRDPGQPSPHAEVQRFFEFSQGQAESYLEKLHKMVEGDLQAMMETAADDQPKVIAEWPKFREAVIGLTDVTHSHFAKLVTELEKGKDMLASYMATEAMDSQGAEAPQPAQAAAATAAAAAAAAASPAPGKKSRSSKRTRQPASQRATQGGGAAGSSDNPIPVDDEGHVVAELAGFWQCRQCTFNNEPDAEDCEMCETARGQ